MGAKGIKPVEPLPPLATRAGSAVTGADARGAPGMVWIALAVLLLSMIVAWGMFMTVPGIRVGGNEFSHDRAIFLAVNCGTLTGFPYTQGISDFNPNSIAGPMVCLVVTIIGVLASLIMGGLAAVRALRLPYRDGQVIAAAAAVTALAGFGGAIILGIGATPGPNGLINALFQSECAFGNCGLVMGKMSELAGWRLHVVLLPLAAVGGLGLPVLMELYDWAISRRPISRHSATTIIAMAGLYLIGLAVLVFFLWPTLPEKPKPGEIAALVRPAIGQASALSVDARTFGFPQSLDALSRPGQCFVMLLMAIGAGSAGTAGGLKVTNLVVLGRGVRQSLRGGVAGRIFGIACTWLGCYVLIAVACWLALLKLEPWMPSDRLAILSVSAASNVGLATETVTIVQGGLYVLSGAMLLGRLTPIFMLWWIARSASGVELLAA